MLSAGSAWAWWLIEELLEPLQRSATIAEVCSERVYPAPKIARHRCGHFEPYSWDEPSRYRFGTARAVLEYLKPR